MSKKVAPASVSSGKKSAGTKAPVAGTGRVAVTGGAGRRAEDDPMLSGTYMGDSPSKPSGPSSSSENVYDELDNFENRLNSGGGVSGGVKRTSAQKPVTKPTTSKPVAPKPSKLNVVSGPSGAANKKPALSEEEEEKTRERNQDIAAVSNLPDEPDSP